MIKKLFILNIFLLLGLYGFSQTTDSLFSIVRNGNDTAKISALLSLAEHYGSEGKLDSTFLLLEQAERIALSVDNSDDLLYKIYKLKARSFYEQSDYVNALKVADSALKLTDDSAKIYNIYHLLATIYIETGLYSEAYKLLHKYILFNQKRHDTSALSLAYSTYALVLSNLGNFDSALYWFKQAAVIDSALRDSFYIALDYVSVGATYDNLGRYDSARVYLNKALSLARQLGDPAAMAFSLNNLGTLEFHMGNYRKAIDYFSQALKYYDKNLYPQYIITSFVNIAHNYLKLKDYQNAKVYLDSAAKYKALVPQISADVLRHYYVVLERYYKSIGRYDSAYFYLKKIVALDDSLQMDKQRQILMVYNAKNEIKTKELELALTEANTKKLRARKNFFKIISFVSIIILILIIYLLLKLKRAYQKLKVISKRDYIFALLYQIRRLAVLRLEDGSLEHVLQKILETIVNTEALNLLPQGIIYLYDEKSDSLHAVAQVGLPEEITKNCSVIKRDECLCGKVLSRTKIIADSNTPDHDKPSPLPKHKHFIAKLSAEDQLLGAINLYFEPDTKITPYINQLLDNIVYEISSIILRYRQHQKIVENAKIQSQLNQKIFAQSLLMEQQKRELDEAYEKLNVQSKILKSTLKDLQDSIKFTSHMIKSYLPSDEYLRQIMGDNYFVLFKPRDVIGGDFYFAEKVNDYLIFAVGDATGHGVPGALLATQAVTFLRHIIFEDKIFCPIHILSGMRENFKKVFQHSDLSRIQSISVEIALCLINLKDQTLHYSGAFMPAIIVRNKQLIKLKPTRNPIGSYIREYDFKVENLELQDGDMIYLQSDGFQDQIGQAKGRKLLKANYYKILVQISDLHPVQQKEVLLQFLEQWKGDNHQTDDITVFGLRWNEKFFGKYIQDKPKDNARPDADTDTNPEQPDGK